MVTDFRVPAAAVVATSRSLRLADLLRTLLDVVERFGESLDDARKSLERADAIREAVGKKSPSMTDDARKRAYLEAVRACSGWQRCFADAERRIGEVFRGVDALLVDIGDAGCRAAAAHLARVQPAAVAFPECTPCPWETEVVRNLAFRSLFKIGRFLDAEPADLAPDDRDGVDAAINLRQTLCLELLAILHSREDLDRLEAAISADLAELNAAVDAVPLPAPRGDIEPRRFAELIRDSETLRASLVDAGAVYPDGGVHLETDGGVSVALFGMTPAGTSRLQAICEHLEPVLRTLGADIGERGETADGRLLRWAVEMIDRSGDEQDRGNPFGLLATAVSRFIARVDEPAPGESKAAETTTSADDPNSELIPDGPFGGDGFAWNGVLRNGLTPTEANIMSAIWNSRSGTIGRSDIDAAWPVDAYPDWGTVEKMLSGLRKKLNPLPVTIRALSRSELIQSNLATLRREKRKVSPR